MVNCAKLVKNLHRKWTKLVFVLGCEPGLPHNEDPIHDLDMASYGLVKCYTDKNGSSYPDMPLEPKKSSKRWQTIFLA